MCRGRQGKEDKTGEGQVLMTENKENYTIFKCNMCTFCLVRTDDFGINEDGQLSINMKVHEQQQHGGHSGWETIRR